MTESVKIEGWQIYITRPANSFNNNDKAPILFSHATAFSALTYQGFLQQWSDKTGHTIYSYDVRGFGETSHELTAQQRIKNHDLWHDLANDLVSVSKIVATMDALGGKEQLILSGHSSGAIFSIMAASKMGIKKLILFDPVALSFLQEIGWHLLALSGNRHRHPLAVSTYNRKTSFANKDQAIAYYKKKSFFKNFTEIALNNYVEASFHKKGSYKLKFAARDEALIFETQPLNMFRYLRYHTNHNFRAEACLTIYGVKSSIMLGQYSRLYFSWLFANARIQILDNGSHMFPLETYSDLLTALNNNK